LIGEVLSVLIVLHTSRILSYSTMLLPCRCRSCCGRAAVMALEQKYGQHRSVVKLQKVVEALKAKCPKKSARAYWSSFVVLGKASFLVLSSKFIVFCSCSSAFYCSLERASYLCEELAVVKVVSSVRKSLVHRFLGVRLSAGIAF
jgi:predicted nucleic acid-binding Zn finger protein